MPAGPEAVPLIFLETIKSSWATMLGTIKIPKEKSIPWKKRERMHLAFTTCMGMYGSGCMTGMEIIREKLSPTRPARKQAPAGWFAAVVGAIPRAMFVLRTVTGTTLASATLIWAFAWRGLTLSTFTLLPF